MSKRWQYPSLTEVFGNVTPPATVPNWISLNPDLLIKQQNKNYLYPSSTFFFTATQDTILSPQTNLDIIRKNNIYPSALPAVPFSFITTQDTILPLNQIADVIITKKIHASELPSVPFNFITTQDEILPLTQIVDIFPARKVLQQPQAEVLFTPAVPAPVIPLNPGEYPIFPSKKSFYSPQSEVLFVPAAAVLPFALFDISQPQQKYNRTAFWDGVFQFTPAPIPVPEINFSRIEFPVPPKRFPTAENQVFLNTFPAPIPFPFPDTQQPPAGKLWPKYAFQFVFTANLPVKTVLCGGKFDVTPSLMLRAAHPIPNMPVAYITRVVRYTADPFC